MISWIYECIKAAAQKYNVSAWKIDRTLRCESWDYDYDVIVGNVLGADGEHGIAQLHPQGLLPLFYKLGYESPYSISNSVDFIAWAFNRGLATHWSCYHIEILGRFPGW